MSVPGSLKHHVMRLWREEDGYLLSTEALFVATILAIGSIVGLVTVRNALIHYFVTEALVVSARTNLFEFDTTSQFYQVETTPQFEDLFGDLVYPLPPEE